MWRRFILAAACVALTFSFAMSETNRYKVSKIVKQGDNYVLTCTAEGTFSKDDKKWDYKDITKSVTIPASVPVTGNPPGEKGKGKGGFGGFGKALEGGFGHAMFETVPEGGFIISITKADADVKKGDYTGAAVVPEFKGKGKGAQ